MSFLPFLPMIPRRSNRCMQCQGIWSPNAEYFSVIVETDGGHLERQDYCNACWNVLRQENQVKTKTSWKSKVPSKENEGSKSLQHENNALELLKNALSSAYDPDQAEAFILALYLARKKILIMRQQFQQSNGQAMTVYEVAGTEEMLAVKKLQLSQLQILTLQQRLALKLKL